MLLLIAVLGIAISSIGQDKNVSFGDATWMYEFPFTTADSVSQFDTLYYVQFTTNKPSPVKYDIQVGIDKLSGTPVTAISLQGKKWAGDAWTNITTVSYGGTADTTINFTQVSTAQYYRMFRVLHDKVGTGAGKYKILTTKVKLWDK